jgi:hypothetical protein
MRRNRAPALRQIATVREAQRAAAEHVARQAAAAVRVGEAAAGDAERRRDLTEESWLLTVNAQSLSPGDASWWSLQLRQEEAAAKSARRDLERSRQVLASNSAAWRAAIARCDHAEAMVLKAKKQQAQQRDEAAVQTALDRHTSKGRSR